MCGKAVSPAGRWPGTCPNPSSSERFKLFRVPGLRSPCAHHVRRMLAEFELQEIKPQPTKPPPKIQVQSREQGFRGRNQTPARAASNQRNPSFNVIPNGLLHEAIKNGHPGFFRELGRGGRQSCPLPSQARWRPTPRAASVLRRDLVAVGHRAAAVGGGFSPRGIACLAIRSTNRLGVVVGEDAPSGRRAQNRDGSAGMQNLPSVKPGLCGRESHRPRRADGQNGSSLAKNAIRGDDHLHPLLRAGGQGMATARAGGGGSHLRLCSQLSKNTEGFTIFFLFSHLPVILPGGLGRFRLRRGTENRTTLTPKSSGSPGKGHRSCRFIKKFSFSLLPGQVSGIYLGL